MNSSYLYGITNEKYVRSKPKAKKKFQESALKAYKYETPSILQGRQYFDPHDISIVFKTSPETLLNLAAKVIDAWPLPSVYTWTIEDICAWLRKYGYPQYQNTFRENLINGRSLLLLNASALSAINIKDFDHIRHIAYGIRCLYFYEVTKFGRSISLAPEFHLEHYKLYRIKNGTKYDNSKRSELWRRMQLIREPRKYRDHWATLEQWLKMEKEPKYTELFGGVRRGNLYRCKENKEPETYPYESGICPCMPPCQCYWTERDVRKPWRISDLPLERKESGHESVLRLLQNMYPHKYGCVLEEIHEDTLQARVHKFRVNMARHSSFGP